MGLLLRYRTEQRWPKVWDSFWRSITLGSLHVYRVVEMTGLFCAGSWVVQTTRLYSVPKVAFHTWLSSRRIWEVRTSTALIILYSKSTMHASKSGSTAAKVTSASSKGSHRRRFPCHYTYTRPKFAAWLLAAPKTAGKTFQLILGLSEHHCVTQHIVP